MSDPEAEAKFLAFYAERDRAEFLAEDSGRAIARKLRQQGVELQPDAVLGHLIQTYGQFRLHLRQQGDDRAYASLMMLRSLVRNAARCVRCGEVDQGILAGETPLRLSGEVVCAGCAEADSA